MTDEERAKGKHILQHMKEYIASGEAAEDFEKLRLKMTDKALDMAMNRTIGPVRQEVEHSGAIGISITREIVRKGQD